MTDPAVPAGDGEHVVTEGDSIVSIAAAAGHLPETVWNDPANEALKQARADAEVLLPGDRVAVMAPRPRSVRRPTGALHRFRRIGVPCKLTLVVEDAEGTPFGARRFELKIEDTVIEGTTDEAGRIDCAVPPAARVGTLSVWLDEPGLPSPWTREVRLGALYPKNHLVGVQQRLANLGFYAGALTGELDEATAAALRVFQAEQEIEVTGEADAATVDKLAALHKI
jgi:hypothetical protein